MANDYDKSNPFFDTNFPAYTESVKWQNEQNFANQQAWDARLYGTWERLQTQLWNEQMYERELEDNSIGAQLQRARAAGVNPAAIVGGDYDSSTSSAPTSSPQSPVMASTPSQNAHSRLAQNLGTVADSLQGAAENYLSEKQVAINKSNIESQMKVNEASIKEILSDAGLKDVNYEIARKNMSWIDRLNYVTIQEKMQGINESFNDMYVKLEELLIRRGELDNATRLTDSDIALKNQQERYYGAMERGLSIENLWKNTIHFSQAELLELQVEELKHKRDIANLIGVPLGTSEYEFTYALARKGLLGTYIEKCVIPNARARMSPAQMVTHHKGGIRGGVSLGVLGTYGGDVSGDYTRTHDVAPYGYYVPETPSLINP